MVSQGCYSEKYMQTEKDSVIQKLDQFIEIFTKDQNDFPIEQRKFLLETSKLLKNSISSQNFDSQELLEKLNKAKELGTWGYELYMFREILLKGN